MWSLHAGRRVVKCPGEDACKPPLKAAVWYAERPAVAQVCTMRFVTDWVLPRHTADLEARLEAVLPKLPIQRRRGLQRLLRQPLESRGLSALHAFATLAEAEGWLDAAEVITIRKLAYRVSFYLRRAESHGKPRSPNMP